MLLKALHMADAQVWITLVAGGVEMLILFLLFGASVAAISRAVAWANLGEPATIRGAYASVLPMLGRYLWLMFITAFIVYMPIVLLYGGYFGSMMVWGKLNLLHPDPAAQQAAMSNPQTAVMFGVASLAFVLLLFPFGFYTVFMSLRYSLALPACVVENIKARAAIRRAINLSKGSRGRIFVLALLIGAIKIGLVLATQLFIVIAAFKNHGVLGPGLTAVSQIIAFFTNTFLGPIWATGVTLFYYDQRVRKEGFDIEWMMQAAGMTAPSALSALPAVADPEATPEDQGSVHE